MSISTRIKNHLEDRKVPYAPLVHPSSFTASGAAAVLHVSGREVAKTVVVHAGKDYLLAVLPASYHLKLEKLAHAVGCPVRLASEAEFSVLFPDCEVGAMPPLGELYALPVYVDESLSADKEIIFNAGTHRDSIRISYNDFVALTQPKICSFAAKG